MKKYILLPAVFFLCIFQLTAQTFISPKSEWKYLNISSDPGTAWRQSNFDDSAWPSGLGEFGFGDGDETTVLVKRNPSLAYYFRKKIQVTETLAGKTVMLHMKHDDGAVVYINGTEILRTPLMPTGTITYTTGTTTFLDPENDYYIYTIDGSKFSVGENTIAIEVHNQNTGSSDISFDAALTTEAPVKNYSDDGPYVLYRNSNMVVHQITDNQLITNTYTTGTPVIITVNVGDGRNFQVPIRPRHAIEPNTYTLPSKMLVTSDIEGNLAGFVSLLEKAGVINNSLQWTFGTGHLVYAGDMFDRGTSVIECLWLMYKLEAEAEQAGGKVHFVLGNHDIMNLTGDLRYVDPKYFESATLMQENINTIHDNNSELGRWVRSKNIVEKIGPYLFAHGGISPQVADLGLNLTQLNDHGRTVMNEQSCSGNCSVVTGGAASGVYWYRGLARNEISQTAVNDILNRMNADKIVIGHTILADTITKRYEDKVYCIDIQHATTFQNNKKMVALLYDNCNFYELTTSANPNHKKLLETTMINGIHLPQANATGALTISMPGIYKIGACGETLAKIKTTGDAGNVSGSINTKLWVETQQPSGFVKRHYEISPEQNADIATGTITLYFTQQEFNDFNSASSIKLPSGPGDNAGVSNFKIVKFSGTSADGSGQPGSYTGNSIIIDPEDSNIKWNSDDQVWEVTFDVAGFSGFFAASENIVLPVTFGQISAFFNNNQLHVFWETLSETNVDYFEVQISGDGKKFSTLQTIKSKAANGSSDAKLEYELNVEKESIALAGSLLLVFLFSFINRRKGWLLIIIGMLFFNISCSKKEMAFEATNNEQVFVRIKQVDMNGGFQYSKTIKVVRK